MKTYDLYGIKSVNIKDAKNIIEKKLSLIFEERDSDYQGGIYYKCGRIGNENLELKKNIDPYDGLPSEEECPDFPILLYVNATDRSDEIKSILSPEFTLVRHETFNE